MLHIAVCDDKQNEREALAEALYSLLPDKPEITEFRSGEALAFELEENPSRFGLIFLDVLMGGMNGIETARMLRQIGVKTPIVFTTFSKEYAVDGYDVEAIAYLIKPLQAEKLRGVLKKVKESGNTQRNFVYRKNNFIRLIPHDDILFVESRDHRLYVHLKNEVLDFVGRMNELDDILNDDSFLRCHQSYLLNMNHVAWIDENFVMDNDEIVLIRKKERKAICDLYYDWLKKKAFS